MLRITDGAGLLIITHREPPFGVDLGYAVYVTVAVHSAALCGWVCWWLLFGVRLRAGCWRLALTGGFMVVGGVC